MRIQSIDTFKGLAILAVVIIHTEPFLATPELKTHWYHLGQLVQQASSFAVPFFFIAAGYFYSRGLTKDELVSRWRKYVTKLALALAVWILIDAFFGNHWLAQIQEAGSLKPLLWNLLAIPSFVENRPDLFFFRGTAVPLWFLISLIVAISALTLCVRLSIRPIVVLAMGLSAYALSLLMSTYSGTGIGTGINLPLEQRGPLIAFGFLSTGYFLATSWMPTRNANLLVAASAAMVFAESMALSAYFHVQFIERPYLFSTLPLAISLLLFAASTPSLGANSIISRIGNRSLGVYLVHTPVLGGFTQIRSLFVHPIWEFSFPILVLISSYAVVLLLLKLPFLGKTVQ